MLQQGENRHLARRPVAGALLDLGFSDLQGLPIEGIVVREPLRDELADPVIEQPSGVTVDADELRRGARGRAGHEVLGQPPALLIRQFRTLASHAEAAALSMPARALRR